MDPSKVLNEEERKKYSQKRIRLDPEFPNGSGSEGPVSETEQSSVNSQSSPESTQMELDPPTTSKIFPVEEIFRTPSPKVARPVPVPLSQFSRPTSSANLATIFTGSSTERSNSEDPSSSIDLASLVQSAQTTFVQEVYNEFKYDPRLANLVVQGHLDPTSWCGSHSAAFLNIMETVIPFMHLAALKSPQFKQVCEHDQRLLLKNNAILLREYLTARYLIAETGMEQLVWAFGPSDSIKLGKWYTLIRNSLFLNFNYTKSAF